MRRGEEGRKRGGGVDDPTATASRDSSSENNSYIANFIGIFLIRRHYSPISTNSRGEEEVMVLLTVVAALVELAHVVVAKTLSRFLWENLHFKCKSSSFSPN